MDDANETTILRRRLTAFENDLTRRRPDQDAGGRALVAKTVDGGHYPSSGMTTYMVRKVDVSGPDEEGGAVSLAPDGDPFAAVNVGSAGPAVGTPVVCVLVDGTWAFKWDG